MTIRKFGKGFLSTVITCIICLILVASTVFAAVDSGIDTGYPDAADAPYIEETSAETDQNTDETILSETEA
jgi:hypothetical protein